ncbi:MAG: sulfatase-like hydrolase/transferase, partial [Acidobacteria bacterium]|nr:sulfatase-like hydrolase/transferase [Acidobacteriota bacterium]
MESKSLNQGFASPAGLLTLTAASGILAGFVEVFLLGIQKFGFGHAILLGPRVVWMAAAADLLLFVTVGLLMVGLLRFRPKLISPRLALTVFVFLSLAGWLLIFPRIKWYASLILAAGLAVRIGQLLRPRLKPSRVKFTAKLAMAVLILLTISCEGWLNWQERQSIADLPAPPANAPNVLLLVMDTVGAQNLSLYGYQRATTPNLEALAKRGAVFETAISTAPWTAPSHAGMFTGHFPHDCSTDWDKPLDRHYPTLAETLRGFGYATGGVVANTLICGYESGLNRGFTHYDDYSLSSSELLVSSSLIRATVHSAPLRRLTGYQQIITRKSAKEINAGFLNWLDVLPKTEGKKARPFFAFLNYFDTHEPYLPPAPFDKKFGQGPATHYRARHELRRSFRYDREKMTE